VRHVCDGESGRLDLAEPALSRAVPSVTVGGTSFALPRGMASSQETAVWTKALLARAREVVALTRNLRHAGMLRRALRRKTSKTDDAADARD